MPSMSAGDVLFGVLVEAPEECSDVNISGFGVIGKVIQENKVFPRRRTSSDIIRRRLLVRMGPNETVGQWLTARRRLYWQMQPSRSETNCRMR